MSLLSLLSGQFLLSLGAGTGLFLPNTHPEQTGNGLSRLISLVAVISALLGYYILETPWWVFLSSVPFLLTIITERYNKFTSLFSLIALGSLSLYVLGIQFLPRLVFMGSVTYGMLLGHWYLVTPKLSEKPLYRVTQWIWISGIIHLITEIPLLLSPGQGDMFYWIVLSMRWIWGFAIIFILNFFTQKLVAMRSLQSATGILYIMVFFLIIGELTSLYLLRGQS